MFSLQIASDANFSVFSSEQLEDDFITNLFSQNTTGHEESLPQSNYGIKNPVAHDTSAWLSAVQMDYGYIANSELKLLSSTSEKPSTVSNDPSRLNMSTYFSSFDPSAHLQTRDQRPDIPKKFWNTQQATEQNYQARMNLVSIFTMVPAKSGNFKAIMKRKRKRTVFRTDQVEAMEELFAKKPYVTKEERLILVDKLNISDKSIKVWFQNRRLKIRRGENHSYSDEENRNSSDIDRLGYVESKIHERINEFGYVTLDDNIMNDLVTVINDYLKAPIIDVIREDMKTEDITMDEPKMLSIAPVYEPISPASTVENSSEDISWEGQSPVGKSTQTNLCDFSTINYTLDLSN